MMSTSEDCQHERWTRPNQAPRSQTRGIHADILGPIITAGSQPHLVLTLTDAIPNYAVVMVIKNKDAHT
jgi:hypothetical protein